MYEISLDRAQGVIRERIWGFWDGATATSFAAAHLQAVRDLGMPAGAHRVIVHFEGFAVQSPETVTIMQQLIAGNRARRIAMVASSALSRVQAGAVLVTPNIRLFEASAEAEAWLFAEGAAGRATIRGGVPGGAAGAGGAGAIGQAIGAEAWLQGDEKVGDEIRDEVGIGLVRE